MLLIIYIRKSLFLKRVLVSSAFQNFVGICWRRGSKNSLQKLQFVHTFIAQRLEQLETIHYFFVNDEDGEGYIRMSC